MGRLRWWAGPDGARARGRAGPAAAGVWWRAGRGSQVVESAVLLTVVAALGASVLVATPSIGRAVTDRYECEIASDPDCAEPGPRAPGAASAKDASAKDASATDASADPEPTDTLGKPDPHGPPTVNTSGGGGRWYLDHQHGQLVSMDWCSEAVDVGGGTHKYYCAGADGTMRVCVMQYSWWTGTSKVCSTAQIADGDLDCDVDAQRPGSFLCTLTPRWGHGDRYLRCESGTGKYFACIDTEHDADSVMTAAPTLCGSVGTDMLTAGPCLGENGTLYWCGDTSAVDAGWVCVDGRDIDPASLALSECDTVEPGVAQCTFTGVEPGCTVGPPDDAGPDPDWPEAPDSSACEAEALTVRCQVSAADDKYHHCLNTGTYAPEADGGVLPACAAYQDGKCTSALALPLVKTVSAPGDRTFDVDGMEVVVEGGALASTERDLTIPDGAGGTTPATYAELEAWCGADPARCRAYSATQTDEALSGVYDQLTALGVCAARSTCEAEAGRLTGVVGADSRQGRCLTADDPAMCNDGTTTKKALRWKQFGALAISIAAFTGAQFGGNYAIPIFFSRYEFHTKTFLSVLGWSSLTAAAIITWLDFLQRRQRGESVRQGTNEQDPELILLIQRVTALEEGRAAELALLRPQLDAPPSDAARPGETEDQRKRRIRGKQRLREEQGVTAAGAALAELAAPVGEVQPDPGAPSSSGVAIGDDAETTPTCSVSPEPPYEPHLDLEFPQEWADAYGQAVLFDRLGGC